MENQRTCRQCGATKHVSEYYAKSGNNCKDCVKKRVSEVKRAKANGVLPSKPPSVVRREAQAETQTRVCTECNESLPTTAFYTNGSGLSGKCKACRCTMQKNDRELVRIPTQNEGLLVDGLKCCSVCKEIKPLADFYPKRDTVEACCKVCKNAYKAKYMQDHPDARQSSINQQKQYLKNNPVAAEARRLYAAAYVQANKEKHNAWGRDWCKKNPQKSKFFAQRWRLANRDVMCFHANKRRVTKLQATPAWASQEEAEIRAVYSLSRATQISTGVKHHVDHIVPLQSEHVCGLHCLANLAVLPALENISKGNRHWPDMW